MLSGEAHPESSKPPLSRPRTRSRHRRSATQTPRVGLHPAPTPAQPCAAAQLAGFVRTTTTGPVGVLDHPLGTLPNSSESGSRPCPHAPTTIAPASCSALRTRIRAPRDPIGTHDERAGVEAHRARESGALFGGGASGAPEFVDLAKDRRVGGGSAGGADRQRGRVPDRHDEPAPGVSSSPTVVIAAIASTDPSYAMRMGDRTCVLLASLGWRPQPPSRARRDRHATDGSARVIHSGARPARFGSVLRRALAVTTVTGSPSFLTWVGRSRCSQRDDDLGIVEMMISS